MKYEPNPGGKLILLLGRIGHIGWVTLQEFWIIWLQVTRLTHHSVLQTITQTVIVPDHMSMKYKPTKPKQINRACQIADPLQISWSINEERWRVEQNRAKRFYAWHKRLIGRVLTCEPLLPSTYTSVCVCRLWTEMHVVWRKIILHSIKNNAETFQVLKIHRKYFTLALH